MMVAVAGSTTSVWFLIILHNNLEYFIKLSRRLLNLILCKLSAISVLRVFLLHVDLLKGLKGFDLLSAQTGMHSFKLRTLWLKYLRRLVAICVFMLYLFYKGCLQDFRKLFLTRI